MSRRPLDEVFQHVLTSLEKVTPRPAGGAFCHMALCPVHADKNPSLEINRGDDGRILAHCYGCEAPFAQIMAALGVLVSECFPEQEYKARDPIVAEYEYPNASGQFIYKRVKTASKQFFPLRPMGDGTWAWGLSAGWYYQRRAGGDWFKRKQGEKPQSGDKKLPAVKPVPFNLPALVAAPKHILIVLCEGEKDAINAHEFLGDYPHVCIAFPGGAGEWRKEWLEFFRDRRIVIVPDFDRPDSTGARKGHVGAEKWANELIAVASLVKVVDLPDLKEGQDFTDWIDAGHTVGEFRDAVEQAPVWHVGATLAKKEVALPTVGENDQMLRELGIQVLGLTKESDILVFSTVRGIETRMKQSQLRFLGMTDLNLWCGTQIKRQVHPGGADTASATSIPLSTVKEAIADVAGSMKISGSILGRGAWLSQDDNGQRKIVLCNDSHLSILNHEFRKDPTPKHGDQVFKFGGDPWFDHNSLEQRIAECTTGQATSVISEAVKLFNLWKWGHTGDPILVVGLLMATQLQPIWPMRPNVFILGRTNSGKSYFGKRLTEMFGPIASYSSGSTKAGIHQAAEEDSLYMILDEIHKNKEGQKILEMIRTGTVGGKMYQGTQNHRARAYAFSNIYWLMAEYSILRDEADRNRFIQLHLKYPGDSGPNGYGHLPQRIAEMGGSAYLRTLGEKLLACAVKNAVRALDLIPILERNRPNGLDYRFAQLYAVPAAILSACWGHSDQDAVNHYHQLLHGRESGVDEPEEKDALDEAFSKTVHFNGQEVSLSKALELAYTRNDIPGLRINEDEANLILANHGVKVMQDETTGEKMLFIAPKVFQKNCYDRDSRWRMIDIDGVLENVATQLGVDSKKARARLSGLSGPRPRGYLIPIDYILDYK